MAIVNFQYPLASVSGKASKDAKEYYTTRFGTTIMSNYPLHRDPEKISARQHELNSNFAQAVQQAKIELADPQLRAVWEKRFKEQNRSGKYKTLRGFVIAQLKTAAPQ